MATQNVEESFSASFLLHLGEALDDDEIIKKFRSIMSPLLTPVKDALNHANAMIASLSKRMDEKDGKIATLENQVCELEVRVDDLEQQGRRGSMQVFGVPEDTPGCIDEKILALCNQQMKVSPPLMLEDLEVVHRLGKPAPGTAATADVPAAETDTPRSIPVTTPADPDLLEAPPAAGGRVQALQSPGTTTQPRPSPRPILVKFSSHRTKARVMNCKKALKTNPCRKLYGTTSPVYVCDDLTKRRAGLAYRARLLKPAGAIADTWTFDSKVLIKDNHNRVHPIMKEEDIHKFERNWFPR